MSATVIVIVVALYLVLVPLILKADFTRHNREGWLVSAFLFPLITAIVYSYQRCKLGRS